MARPKILILIPARYASSRFPGKPLAMIQGKPMIAWVYEHAAALAGQDWDVTVRVVTDDERIASAVESFGGKVCRVDDEVSTGTERIYLAAQRFFQDAAEDLVINLQGDEPLLTTEDLRRLIQYHLRSSFDVATMVQKKEAGPEFYDINRVKVIYSPTSGECHYFSRAAIPARRDGQVPFWYLHIGVYSFRPAALAKFCQAAKSYYEDLEKLEQLRAIENGQTVGAVAITTPLQSVDCPADIEEVERRLSGTGK